MKRIILLFILSVAAPLMLFAQQRVTGTIRDSQGPIPGATVTEKNVPNNATGTNSDGKFTIVLRGKTNVLVIKSIGYKTQEIRVTGDILSDTYLQSESKGLDEVVVQGFSNKTKITSTGSVSTISAEKIRNIPTSSVQNTLQGRLPGFTSQQRSGQPGKDASDFQIRGISSLNSNGNKPLIIVDDIEYTYEQLSQINVNEIESISLLKDAATTAIYGIKGANGVLVVQTRRGEVGKPTVNFRIEGGVQNPVKTPKFLNAYQTALLRNEALKNDGLQPDFTQADLNLFQNGSDPYGHPDVNWYDVVFKPASLQANTNIDISGGTPNVKYFISAGALTQNGSVRDFSGPQSEVNSNFFYHKYNFRTNLDLKATKTLDLRIDLTGRFGDINAPKANSGLLGEIYQYNRISPYAAPVMNPNGSYSYNPKSIGADNLPTINSRLATQGYNRERSTDFNILVQGTQKLDFLTQGLSFNGKVAYASTTKLERGLQRYDDPPVYRYNPTTDTYAMRPGTPRYVLSPLTLISRPGSTYKSVTVQGILNYNRDFGNHNINGLAVFNQNTTSDLSILPANYRGYSFRVGYGYKRKYLIDFNSAYNGTDRFLKHYGYFPAVSAAWNISEENFIKDKAKFIDFIKLRASYGLVGSDVVDGNKYLYIQQYDQSSSYNFGVSPVRYPGISEGTLGNPDVTWEKYKELNIGLETNFMKGKFALTVEYYRNIRDDQLINRNSVSAILGVGLPKDNLGSVLNQGVEGTFNYRPKIGNLLMDFGLVFTYNKNKVLFKDEPFPDYPYLLETGKPIGQPFGYTWIGYYKDQADIANSAKPLGTVPIQPGDLKYADLNNDGVINDKDKSAIGKPNFPPNLTIGLPINFTYKNFSVNVLFQGQFGYSLILGSNAIEPFQTQLQDIHLQRWTPATAETAKFPRLSTLNNSVNSPGAFPSDFYLIDAKYIRLKTVELHYQLPSKWLPFGINKLNAYVSSYNLATWTNYSLYQQDPEVASGSQGDSYLNQRIINLGVQIGF
jgi:TonB-linked SusC/RagA family outer membrane protein